MRVDRTFFYAHTSRMTTKHADTSWLEMIARADEIVAHSNAVAALFSPQRIEAPSREDLSRLEGAYDQGRNSWTGAQKSPPTPHVNRKAPRRCLRI
jgi:hypothetical protein